MRTPLQEWLYEPRVLYPTLLFLGGPEPRPRTPPALLTEATASAHIGGGAELLPFMGGVPRSVYSQGGHFL